MYNHRRILAWNDPDIKNEPIGGKAQNLLVLSLNGLPVPAWHCVTSKFYKEFIKKHEKEIFKLYDKIDYSKISQVFSISDEMKKILTTPNIIGDIEELIESQLTNNSENFAVRSSCNLEDSSNLSFAGIFDTYLNVPTKNLAHYVHKCWLSVFNSSSLVYLMKNNLSLFNLSMSVTLQTMVESEKSGIIFQANPAASNAEELVVIAGYGLGEGIVDDKVQYDTYFIDHNSENVKSEIMKKKYYMKADKDVGYGIKRFEIPEETRKKQVLNETELAQLIDLSNSISRIFQKKQDIEWAIDNNGKLFLLQSRAITANYSWS